MSGASDETTFVRGIANTSFTNLVSIEKKPFCVRFKHDHFEAILTTSLKVVDLDAITQPNCTLLDSFFGLAPLMIFLYASLDKHLWHNDSPAGCFIVDDPLLRTRYGCLDYRKLLDLVDRKGFSASIAFIPWNYRI